jgi:hypothetical protein
LAGEQPGVAGGQRIGRGTVGDDAEHHGDRDDGHSVMGGAAAQILQRKEGE